MRPAVTDPPEIEARLWHDFTGNIGWDVGANCGQSLAEMQTRFEQVVAFEPASECWPYLRQYPEVKIMPVALSDVDDEIDLVEIPDKINTGQLVTAGTVGMEWDPGQPDAVVRRVPSFTIDALSELMDRPDFLKIDVEGHELRVLYGARKLLAIVRPSLLVEFHAPNLHRSALDMLDSFGYSTETVRHPHYYPGTPLWFGHGWIRAWA